MRWRRANPKIVAALRAYEHSDANELVRVWLKGRRNRRAAVCLAGRPRIDGTVVHFYNPDGAYLATTELTSICAVQKVFADRPLRAHETRPTTRVAPTATTPTASDRIRRGVIRAELELDATKAFETVEKLRRKAEEAAAPLRQDDQ